MRLYYHEVALMILFQFLYGRICPHALYHHHCHNSYQHIHHHFNPQNYHPLQEESWLYTAKMAGYAISIVLLVVYILTIQVFSYASSSTPHPCE